jgi:hypothetical protein
MVSCCARELCHGTSLSFPGIFLEGLPQRNFRQQNKAASYSNNGRQSKRSQLKTDLEFPERQDQWNITTVRRTDLTRRCNEVRRLLL